jgi:hypothetical protein
MYIDLETHLCIGIWKHDRSWFQIALACYLVVAAFPGIDLISGSKEKDALKVQVMLPFCVITPVYWLC